MDSTGKEKERWYPGKYLSKNNRRRSVEVSRSGSIEEHPEHSRRAFNSSPTQEQIEKIPDLYVCDKNENKSGNISTSDLDTIGTLKVHVVDIKYLRMSSAKLTIQLDRVSSQYSVDASSKSFDRCFDLHEIASDIKITILGRGDSGELVCGVVVIPVTSLLSFSGKPVPPKEQWRQLYPVCVSRVSDVRPYKFSAGYADLHGYALNRSKDPLGYVCIKADLTLACSMIGAYFAKGGWGWKKTLASAPWVEIQEQSSVEAATNVRSNAELCAMINRDMNRILAVFRLPLSLTSAFSLPEVLVVNLILGCTCFVVDSWQVPLVLASFCALNGLIAMSQRSHAGVTVWNEPLPLTLVGTPADPNHSSNLPANMDPLLFLAGHVPASVSAYPAAAAAARSLLQTADATDCDLSGAGASSGAGAGGGSGGGGGGGAALNRVQSSSGESDTAAVKDKPTVLRLLIQQNLSLGKISRTLIQVAHFLEVACNMLSFADPRASIIAFTTLFAAAAVTSLGLIAWPRMLTFIVTTSFTMVCATGAVLLDMVAAKAANRRSMGNEQMAKVSDVMDRIVAFIHRVPDELELIHRHIASTAVVNPKGSEMQDAALAFEKRSVR